MCVVYTRYTAKFILYFTVLYATHTADRICAYLDRVFFPRPIAPQRPTPTPPPVQNLANYKTPPSISLGPSWARGHKGSLAIEWGISGYPVRPTTLYDSRNTDPDHSNVVNGLGLSVSTAAAICHTSV